MVAKQTKTPTDLERLFKEAWDTYAPPGVDYPLFQYDLPGSKYVIDFAFPSIRLAIEIDGGSAGGAGRTIRCHVCGAVVRARLKNGGLGKPIRVAFPSHSGAGQERDRIRDNFLTEQGWITLRYGSDQVRKFPQKIVLQVISVARLIEVDDINWRSP